jgi:hypothetical protein
MNRPVRWTLNFKSHWTISASTVNSEQWNGPYAKYWTMNRPVLGILNNIDHTAKRRAGENPIQYKCLVPICVLPEMKLLFPKQNFNVLTPSSYTHISVRDLYTVFPGSVCLFCSRKYVDRCWEYKNQSQTHECGNWDWSRAIPRKGIHICDFRYSGARWTLNNESVFTMNTEQYQPARWTLNNE